MAYHHDKKIHNKNSAQEIIPLLFNIFPSINSVADVGCGLGEWLAVFKEKGVSEILGINGDWTNIDELYFDKKDLKIWDLTQPLKIAKKYDLVLCLEVAEHLPESAADTIVETLSQLGNNIIFSAAIPHQGGQNHLNEQWPEYWADKFKKHGFYFHDCIRPIIWDNASIFPWYRQNMFLVSNQEQDYENQYLNIAHPELYEKKMKRILNGTMGLRFGFHVFKQSLYSFIRRKINGKP